MLILGLIALYAIPCAAGVLIPFYFFGRHSPLYWWTWSTYLIICFSGFGLFVAQWQYDSTHQHAGSSNWGRQEGPITILGDVSNNIFQLAVIFATIVFVTLFLVSGWGHPKRANSGDHGANNTARSTRYPP